MTDNGNRLFITEFDTIQKDIHERALDLEDFIRLAYSYPYTDGIILWNFMRTKNAGEGSNEWDVHMFEDEINSLSEPYLTANNGEPYPLYPNEVRDILTKRTLFLVTMKIPLSKAGMALINLWREEWRSNEIVQVSSGSSGWNSVRRNVFNGEYTINVRSGTSGELIESRNISISNKNCIQMKEQDLGPFTWCPSTECHNILPISLGVLGQSLDSQKG